MTTENTFNTGDIVNVKNQRGWLSRSFKVLWTIRDYVVVDLDACGVMPAGFHIANVKHVKAMIHNFKRIEMVDSVEIATKTAPDAVQATHTGNDTGHSIGGTVEPIFDALQKQLSELATTFDLFVQETITEQSALVGEVSFYLDLTWTLTERLGKARKQARDWRTVAENTVKEAARAETERDELRDRVKALEEQLRQAQAERDLFEARLSDVVAAQAAPKADKLRETLSRIKVDELSPIEAMTKLYELKRAA